MEQLDPDAILEFLDPEQRAVASCLQGPMVVLAGAGTGKTRAITHRIAYGIRTGRFKSSSVLAVTFTARAAGEMRLRLKGLGAPGVNAKTFHAAALKQLKYFWPQAIGGPMSELIEYKGRYLGEAARHIGLKVDSVSIRDIAREIEWAKVSLIDPEDYVIRAAELGRDPVSGFTPEQIGALALGYENLKEQRGLIDFEDILTLLGGILAENTVITDMVRRQYQHFVVDEYQDVSPLQQFVLDQWLGDRDNLCVVGDPSQTIYSFTGATPDYLLGFRRKYPQATEIRLIRDYRSTPQIVKVANNLLAEGRVAGALTLKAQRRPGPDPSYNIYNDDDAEATQIAERAKRLIDNGTPASEIAVLYRTNAQSQAFERAFSEAEVGFQLKGSEQFFNRPEVRQALSLLASRRGVETTDEEPLPALVRRLLSDLGWAPLPPAAQGAMRERWDSMCALVALADGLAQQSGSPGAASARKATMSDFLAELRERVAHQHAPTIDGVTLSSLHSAKGLEWDVVFLAGLSEGLLPISLADTPELVAEERRLLYVGVTRARERLELSYSLTKPGGKAKRKPSRFLSQHFGGNSSQEGNRSRGDSRRSRKPVNLDGPDQEMFEKLRVWRADTARAIGKPAFTVLPDSSLEALAQSRPANVTALANIPGIGPVKIERYGDDILDLVAEAA